MTDPYVDPGFVDPDYVEEEAGQGALALFGIQVTPLLATMPAPGRQSDDDHPLRPRLVADVEILPG